MNQKYKRIEIENKILDLCYTPKSSKELSKLIEINFNTLRSKYIYPLLKKNEVERYQGRYKTVKKEIINK